MATLSIVLGPHTFSKTISAPHIARFLAAYKVIYGQVPNGAGGLRDRTDAEVAQAVADGLFAGMKANVMSQERAAVSKTAHDSVADLALT